MNYQIIKDEKLLREFIEWLPSLEPSNIFYLTLLARSKYAQGITHISSDKQQLRRFTSNKEFMFEKIKQLECELGSYRQKHNPIPNEALALYISLNPRDHFKAGKQLLIKLADLITKNYSGWNLHQEAMSCLQQSCGKKIYMDFDIDIEGQIKKEYIESLQNEIDSKINCDCYKILRTRGGVHILVELAKIDPKYSKTWYNNMATMKGCDMKGSDTLIPVPGTSQGNFVPYFIK